MARRGDDFHRLVEHLERVVSASPDLQIEAPKYFIDKSNGQRKEHDIVLTYHQPMRTVVIAIECRDPITKVDSPQVEAFHGKCNHNGIDKGVIVSSRGFTEPAIKKAAAYGIDCMTLESIEKMRRIVFDGIYFTITIIGTCDLRIRAHRPMEGPLQFFSTSDGGTLNQIDLGPKSTFGLDIWNTLSPEDMECPELLEESGTLSVEMTNPQDFFIVDSSGDRQPMKELTVSIPFTNELKYLPFKFHQQLKDDQELVLEAGATDPVTFEDISARFVTTFKDDTLTVALLADAVANVKRAKES